MPKGDHSLITKAHMDRMAREAAEKENAGLKDRLQELETLVFELKNGVLKAQGFVPAEILKDMSKEMEKAAVQTGAEPPKRGMRRIFIVPSPNPAENYPVDVSACNAAGWSLQLKIPRGVEVEIPEEALELLENAKVVTDIPREPENPSEYHLPGTPGPTEHREYSRFPFMAYAVPVVFLLKGVVDGVI